MSHVILKILGGIEDGFADLNKRGKVNAGFDVMLPHDPPDEIAVARLALVKRNIGRQCGTVTVHQVVQYDDPFTLRKKAFDGYAADVARATGDQDRHARSCASGATRRR